MKILARLVCCVLIFFSPPIWAANEDCTLCAGDWGPIATFSADCGSGAGNCIEGPVPDADDHIICPDGADPFNIIDDITYTTDGSSLELQSGCNMTIDIPALEKVITIHFRDGQDGITVGGTVYNDVALWQEAAASLDIQSAFLTYGRQIALWQTEVTKDNDTLWVVDKVSPCDLGADDTAVPGGVGGNNDCATGTDMYGFSLSYSNARNNPKDTATGDSYLYESINELTAKMMDCFTSGMETGHCYQIGAVDKTQPGGGQFAISLRVMQLIQPDEAAIDYVAFPKAQRQQVLVTAINAADKGDRCIDMDDTGTDWIAADGDYIGACAYIYDSSGINGWDRPIPIARSLDDEDCDGAAGDDSVWFPQGIPYDIAANSQMVIAPICVGRGDKYFVMAAPIFEVEDGNTIWALGEGKFLLEGANRIRGLVMDTSGLVLCEGSSCEWNADQVHFYNCGTDGGPAMMFQDTDSAIMSCSSIVGGPQTGDGDGILFDGVTGLTQISDIAIRYNGGTAIGSVSGAAMGPAVIDTARIDRVGRDVMGTDEVNVKIASGTWSSVVVQDLMTADSTGGTSDYAVESKGTDTIVSGFAERGRLNGGVVKGDPSDDVLLYNLLSQQTDSTVGAGKTYIGSFLDFAHIEDFKDSTGVGNGFAGATGLLTTPVRVRNAEFVNPFTTSNYFLYCVDAVGCDLMNNSIWNANSSNANCTNGTGCSVIFLNMDDDDTAVTTTVEGQLIGWDKDTEFSVGIWSDDVDQELLNFGGNVVTGFLNNTPAINIYGLNLDAEVAAGTVQRAGRDNNCVTDMEVSGTADYAINQASYTTTPIFGTAPEFEAGTHSLKRESVLARLRCGTNTGPQKPGVMVGHSKLYEFMGVDEPQRKPMKKWEEFH